MLTNLAIERADEFATERSDELRPERADELCVVIADQYAICTNVCLTSFRKCLCILRLSVLLRSYCISLCNFVPECADDLLHLSVLKIFTNVHAVLHLNVLVAKFWQFIIFFVPVCAD